MTLQEIFDTVVAHLHTQGKRSRFTCSFDDIKITVSCAYRGEDGTKCAYGVLIPDDEYNPKMEHKTAGVLHMIDGYVAPAIRNQIGDLLSQEHLNLCNALQIAHDTSTTPQDIQNELVKVATRFELDPSSVKPFATWG